MQVIKNILFLILFVSFISISLALMVEFGKISKRAADEMAKRIINGELYYE